MKNCAYSLSKEMVLDESSRSCFTIGSSGSDCHHLVYDVDFLRRTIRGMKEKLEQAVSKLKEKLLQNFQLGVGINEEAGYCHPTPYSNALNHIGAQLEKKQKIKESM